MSIIPAYNGLDYELIDFGRGRKLERFGAYVLDRPETLASGDTKLSKQQWNHLAHARYDGPETGKGRWIHDADMPQTWEISCTNSHLKVQLFLSPFKHIGIFPEQNENWAFLSDILNRYRGASVLNLFAYTGVASLVSSSSGAQVTHVDASKSITNRARTNLDRNHLSDVRWIVDDALKFVGRALRRGNVYQGIILDPPAFGRGPKGELWKLEEQLPELLRAVCALLDPERGFLILNTYSPALPLEQTETMLKAICNKQDKIESNWLSLSSRDGRNLPMSIVNRVIRG